MGRAINAIEVFRRRGAAYAWYLVRGWLLPWAAYRLFSWIAPPRFEKAASLSLALALTLLGALAGYALAGWSGSAAGACGALAFVWGMRRSVAVYLTRSKLHRARSYAGVSSPEVSFTAWAMYPVEDQVRRAVDMQWSENHGQEIELGRLDNDGRVAGTFGPLPYAVNIRMEEFVPRYRFPLSVVLLEGVVLIRKEFHDQRSNFVCERLNLAKLAGRANVPALYRADEERNIIYKSVVPGRTLRDVLVDAGADILSVHTSQDPSLANLRENDRLEAVLSRGSALLKHCLPETFFTSMEEQMDAIHRSGVAKLSLTFGNIMVDGNGAPWFIDLEGSKEYGSTDNPVFRWYRDQDRQKFNMIYKRSLLTESSARRELAHQVTEGPGWYAPIDFGGGLAVRGFWAPSSGTGRWEYLNRRIVSPLVKGKRVLDLGSNNGIMPMMMLREGAGSVLGLELSNAFFREAGLVKRVFEWRDMRRYDLEILNENMTSIIERDFGRFDVVTSFCSLYYLSEQQMAAVVRRSAEIATVMVVQANEHTRSEAADDKARKSSVNYLKVLLLENGFRQVVTHAPSGFARPLLVATR